MKVREKLLNHLEHNPDDYMLGYAVLARKLDTSVSAIYASFKHPELADWKAKRGSLNIPIEWDRYQEYTKKDFWKWKKELKERKRKEYLSRFTTLTYQAEYGDVVIFADDANTVLDHLQNGLSTMHKHTLSLLDRYDRVASQYHDGSIIVSDKKGHIASDNAAHIYTYRKYVMDIGEKDYGKQI